MEFIAEERQPSCNENKYIKMKTSNTNNNNSPIAPAVIYPDPKDQKDQILRENKGKAGIYR
jgi:hypothetical protein